MGFLQKSEDRIRMDLGVFLDGGGGGEYNFGGSLVITFVNWWLFLVSPVFGFDGFRNDTLV